MAHLKHTPKTYAEAAEILQGRDSIKLGNNTWLEDFDGGVAVRLHDTRIVKFWLDGSITLQTGGYRTVTTKERLNQFVKGIVFQQAHKWYVATAHTEEGRIDFNKKIPFYEGINVA